MYDGRMNLIVTSSGDSRGQLRWKNHCFDCALGKGGITSNKMEGDGATPIGIFALRALYVRPDRMGSVASSLPQTALRPEMGWCDDPDDRNYNLPVSLPYEARHEKLWRDDSLYDLIVPMGYNDDPVVAGRGSCIFMHVAKEGYLPTAGCVALHHADLLQILSEISPDSKIEISG